MSRAGVTIAGTMALVALAAIGLATLRRPTTLAASAVFTLVVSILFAAVVAAVSLPGRARATWSSFAICGLSYVALSPGPDSEPKSVPQLFTVFIIESAWNHFVSHIDTQSPDPIHDFFDGHRLLTRSPWDNFHQIARSLFGLAVAAAGGLLAILLTRNSRIFPPKCDAERTNRNLVDHP